VTIPDIPVDIPTLDGEFPDLGLDGELPDVSNAAGDA